MAIEYLNNPMLEKTIDKFKTAKKGKKKKNRQDLEAAQIELATFFYILAKNIIRAFKFQLVDKDDALQEGVMICFEKLDRFDPDRGRAFNYMTTCILNHFKQLYRSAKNYNELKFRYHNHLREKIPNYQYRPKKTINKNQDNN